MSQGTLQDIIIAAIEEVATTPGRETFDIDDVFGFLFNSDAKLRRALVKVRRLHAVYDLADWLEGYARQRIATVISTQHDDAGIRVYINAEAQGKRGVYCLNLKANSEYHRKVAMAARKRALKHALEADFREAIAERMDQDGVAALEDYGDEYEGVIEEVREEKQGAITAAVVKLID
jgi:hypothetical protein